jgi:hypothetical protein
MPIIEIETPSGRQKVEIAGETPNQQELQAIQQTFFPDAATRTSPGLDLATASREEIQEYARQRRAAGVSPTTGEPLTEEEFISEYKEPGVDYQTGLDGVSGFSRTQFGRMDTAEEKAAYLESVVGSEGYRTDALNRFILTEEGRQTLGMGEGKELAIDEEGLSFGDVKEFFGQSGVPIATGIGASLMASGVGFFPGLAIAGAGAAAGKLLDESVEYAEGLQRQSLTDVGRDAAMEGVFAGVGEGFGRALSGLFGRMIKGPGGESNEALRSQARQMIDRGIRPTVTGATSEEFRPVLNRLQAIYEGVFPNEKAARQNLDVLLKELQGITGATGREVQNLGEVVQRDLTKFYGAEDDLLAMAQRNLDQTIENEVKQILRPLKEGLDAPQQLVDDVLVRKSLFDEDMDALFTRSTDILRGKNNIVPTKGIKESLEELVATSPADIGNTKFAAQIRGLSDYATPIEVNRLRKALTDASYNPDLVAGVQQGALGSLKAEVNRSMVDAELALQRGLNTLQNEYGATSRGAQNTLNSVMTPGQEAAEDVALSVDQLRNGLSLLRRSNQLYRDGIKRFDNVVTQDIIKTARKGQLNSRYIYNKIIQEDNPEALDQLLKAVRGVPNLITDIGESRRFLQNQRIGSQTVEEALDQVKDLPANNQTRRFVEREAERIRAQATERAALRGTGAQAANDLREKLAKTFIDRSLRASRITDPATGQRIIDPVKLANELSKKGTTVDKLFGKDKAKLDSVIDTLKTSKANIAPTVAEDLGSRPLAEALDAFKTQAAERQVLGRDAVLRKLETGDVDEIADVMLKQPNAVAMGKRALNPETMEGVRDAAMGRIINQIGGTVEEGGQIQLSGNFLDRFSSGSLGNDLNRVLRSYGKEHIDNLFGKNTYDSLLGISDDMTRASNAAIKGKGGLAAPQIALSLSIVGFITNPVATVSTAASFGAMSKLLRSPTVLKAMMASRRKNSVKDFLAGKFTTEDPIGQGFQAALQIASAAGTQGIRMGTGQAEEETRPAQAMARQQIEPQMQQMRQQVQRQMPQLPNVQPGMQMPQQPASSQPRNEVSPILVPNPVTRATVGSR